MCDVEFVAFAAHCVSACLCLVWPLGPAAQAGCLCGAVWSERGAGWRAGPGTACHPEASWPSRERRPQKLEPLWPSWPWRILCPAGGKIDCNAQSVGTELHGGEINSCIYTHHIMSISTLSWVFSLVMSGKFRTVIENMSARSNYKD